MCILRARLMCFSGGTTVQVAGVRLEIVQEPHIVLYSSGKSYSHVKDFFFHFDACFLIAVEDC